MLESPLPEVIAFFCALLLFAALLELWTYKK